ncbi:S8 family serine peptidase [Leptolyngbya sp. FACHB-711]|uniref:S8 family serine peptidase n=1 Tax=Leptolyngbya sp. FACHB-711 TaxID=2692813 RepID=UPI00168A34BD|nr:S8 family serine peptidase [Leptolyngbya sp. FACHB-711]MBD2025146.1 S8 family serine peptidase [Leptolyngbya sp. FACHB-711]
MKQTLPLALLALLPHLTPSSPPIKKLSSTSPPSPLELTRREEPPAIGKAGNMVGRITSEGDRAMRSDVARRLFGLTGKGITIGIISDSFNVLGGAGRDVRGGDLPGKGNPFGLRQRVKVLRDDRVGIDEGRAMAQIVHDVAPGAKLLFHRSGITETEFAGAIRRLAQAGADVIVDDIGYSTALLLQDGIAAQAVDEVAGQGVLYFSAAGNDGNRSYESPFIPSSTFDFRGTTYTAHDFAAGAPAPAEPDLFQDIKISGFNPIGLLLNWDQPAGRISSDIELFLLDRPLPPGQGSSILAQGVLPSLGLIDPALQNNPGKLLVYQNQQSMPQTGYLMLALRTSASLPFPSLMKWISVANGGDSDTAYQYVNDQPNAAGGSTVYGHPNAAGAIAVGSAFYRRTPAFGVNPPLLDKDSSRGGSPILLSPAGDRLPASQARLKPEIVGPNGVSTTVFGFAPFFGTSAAAPHLAAVAALMLQRAGGRKSLTLSRTITDLQQTAIQIAAVPGLNPQVGFVQAEAAVLSAFQFRQAGSTRSDTLQGTIQADNLLGLEGSDRLLGNKGFDWLNGNAGVDRLRGQQGNDLLTGGTGADRLEGGAGNDTLIGGMSRDVLLGGRGADLLWGGAGRNRLIDEQGKNTFVLSRGGFARITDFQPGRDRLGLADIPFARLTIRQQEQDSLIQLGRKTLASLEEIDATLLIRKTFLAVNLPEAIG